MSAMNRQEILNAIPSIGRITITNGNRSSKSSCKIYDKNNNKVFETIRVWNGSVQLNKNELAEIKSKLP